MVIRKGVKMHKPCAKCGKMFEPTSYWNKVCFDCIKKMRELPPKERRKYKCQTYN